MMTEVVSRPRPPPLSGSIAPHRLAQRFLVSARTVPASYALAAVGVLLLAAATATHDWRWVLAAFTLADLFATGTMVS